MSKMKNKLRRAELKCDEIRNGEEALFNEWRFPGFISDGVVNPEEYCKSNLRILIVLKEVNGGKDWDLRDFLRNSGGRNQTWGPVARWIKGIRNLPDEYDWESIETVSDQDRIDWLKDIAAINVKKLAGGAVADSKKIRNFLYSERNREYLKRQVNLYKPDLVILGNTGSDWYLSSVDWKVTKRGIKYCQEDNGTIVVSYSHPGARVGAQFLYYGLMDALREIMY